MSTLSSNILVCGDAMVDEYWYGEVKRISPEAPVPVVRVTRKEDRFGAADNVAANCHAMGARVFPATAYTSRKIRVVGQNQQVVRVDFDDFLTEEGISKLEASFREYLPQCPIVIFSDYGKGSLRSIRSLISEAKTAGAIVLVDPKGHDYRKYRGADLIKPNVFEMREVCGGWSSEDELAHKAEQLRKDAGISAILVTRAAEGMSLFDAAGASHFPAVAREVYDVTGAGDTAIAAYACALSRGFGPKMAIGYANKASGIAVAHFGTAVVNGKEVFG
jgi:rfaE bifunctional protein kinase chain/domain